MDTKKFFPGNNNGDGSKTGSFFEKWGIYIILVLCITIVVVTAALTGAFKPEEEDNQFINDSEENNQVADNTEISDNENDSEDDEESSNDVSEDETNTENNEQASEETNKDEQQDSDNNDVDVTDTEKDEVPVSSQTEEIPEDIELALPVFGPIEYDYSMDKLVYSATLEEWRTHSGIDITAVEGTEVTAADDGIILEVNNDPRYGVTIVIDHLNGVKTVYANLAKGDMVCPNQKVKKGDVIGKVGQTALFECAQDPHLHFEVWIANTVTDPKLYLPLEQ